MAGQYDPTRLAQLRDKHAELRGRYSRSVEAVRQAAADLSAARREAPPRIVNLKLPRHAFAEGIRHNKPPAPSPEYDGAYLSPVESLRALSTADIQRLQLNAPAVKRIVSAGERLQRLRNEHNRLSDEVTSSCTFMAQIENFAKANRL